MKTKIFLLSILIASWAVTASAYIGPGAGLSLLGALWGLLLAVGAALAFIVLWPLRRLRQRSQCKDNNALNKLDTNDALDKKG